MDSAKELNNSIGRGKKYRYTSNYTHIRREIRKKLYRQSDIEEGNDMETRRSINSNPSLQSLLTILTH